MANSLLNPTPPSEPEDEMPREVMSTTPGLALA